MILIHRHCTDVCRRIFLETLAYKPCKCLLQVKISGGYIQATLSGVITREKLITCAIKQMWYDKTRVYIGDV